MKSKKIETANRVSQSNAGREGEHAACRAGPSYSPENKLLWAGVVYIKYVLRETDGRTSYLVCLENLEKVG